MSNYEVISKEPVSVSEVESLMEKKVSETELTYREEKISEYMKKFSQLSQENFEKAKEEILSLEIPRLEEEHIIKIIDIMPKNGTELRAIVSHSGTVLVDESVNKILDVLNKYK